MKAEPGNPKMSARDYPRSEEGFRNYLDDTADRLFPFDGYRDHQREILTEAIQALYVDGHKNVIIEGPTGIGKSPVNVTIGRVTTHLSHHRAVVEDHFGVSLGIGSGKTFYTTPQKQLRNQLARDKDLKEYVQMLEARADYICEAASKEKGEVKDCSECRLGKVDADRTCSSIPGCTYWSAKEKAMEADIAALTFAMLIVDDYVPTMIGGGDTAQSDLFSFGDTGRQISFGDRDVVIVDEGHNLEEQVASLFAGFTVSYRTLPDTVWDDAGDTAGWDADRYEHVEDEIDGLMQRAKRYIGNHDGDPEKEDDVEKCKRFVSKAAYCQREVEDGRPWVVNVESDGRGGRKIELKPVDVDKFLRDKIWSRGNKRVISSATIPYRDDISKWSARIGLDGSTKHISKPMPFPEENRLIHTDTAVGALSGGGEDEHWDELVARIEEIAASHNGENGLIHTVSYDRAEKLSEAMGGSNTIVQDDEKDKAEVIEHWQSSDKDILLSPSMMEGVDLHGELCRWQVLMKAPYSYIGDSRVGYLLNERADWEWYNETAMLDIMQSVGRAVRGPDDYASYYVIDSSFDKLMDRVETPDWFNSAVRNDD